MLRLLVPNNDWVPGMSMFEMLRNNFILNSENILMGD